MRPLILAALVAALCSGRAGADPSSWYITTGISPGWSDGKGHGFAHDVIREFQIQSGESVQLETFPLRRAIGLYLRKGTECLMGGDAPAMDAFRPMEGIYSLPFRRSGIVIYSLAGTPPVHSVEEARQLRLGLEAGFDFHRILDLLPGLSHEAAPAENQINKMLAGRIDAYVGLFPPSSDYGAQLSFDPNFMLMTWNDTLHCRAGEANEILVESFNKFVMSYQKSGALRRTFGKHFMPNAWVDPSTKKDN